LDIVNSREAPKRRIGVCFAVVEERSNHPSLGVANHIGHRRRSHVPRFGWLDDVGPFLCRRDVRFGAPLAPEQPQSS